MPLLFLTAVKLVAACRFLTVIFSVSMTHTVCICSATRITAAIVGATVTVTAGAAAGVAVATVGEAICDLIVRCSTIPCYHG